MSPPWWAAFPPAETRIPCGTGQHLLRWAEGQLSAADHADAEAELVLAALGGDKAECVSLVEAWQAHAGNLDVLVLGPRSPADQLAVTWDRVAELRSASSPWGGAGRGPVMARPAAAIRARRGPMAGRSHRGLSPELQRAQARREEVLSLFALGREFQFRLSAAVAAAWSAGRPGQPAALRPGQPDPARPTLTAALAGRLAPRAAPWCGLDPGQVRASLHEGPGWGTLRLDADSTGPALQVSLPVSWLARVWGPGLAVVGGYLVLDVLDVTWPRAQVLGLRAPGAEPVVLSIGHDGDTGPWCPLPPATGAGGRHSGNG